MYKINLLTDFALVLDLEHESEPSPTQIDIDY